MDRIIKTTSNENDLILDPFCGSGTTAISCLKNKRKFVGFELEKEYVDLAIKRLNDC
jgi:DNA modification methylase